MSNGLRWVWRFVSRNLALVSAAVLSLGLGIGASTAIFAVMDGILMKKLPYDKPDHLVTVFLTNSKTKVGFADLPVNVRVFRAWQQATAFESIAAYQPSVFNFVGIGDPQRLVGVRASASMFRTLGVAPSLG